jgi:hypothetical protein
MGILTRTFIEKSNTIIKEKKSNVGLNPILELNYGHMLTRGMIYFDHTKVKNMIEDKIYPDMSKLRHILKMTNTASLNKQDIYRPCTSTYFNDNKERAKSFDIIFFLINKEWDNGVGYDFVKDMHKVEHRAYSQDGSNWYQFRNYFKWDEEGIYSTNTLSKEFDKFTSKNGNLSKIIIGYQHFDYGNENIEFDITDIFNKFVTGELPNYGIGIAFAPSYEYLETDMSQYVGFFTQHTHSFFEPYVETTYDETIEDDRVNFYLDKDNKLYFYASVGNKRVNLDELPTCIINGSEIASKQATKGVYYVDINLSSDEYEYDTMLYDTWTNLKYKGKVIKDVELSFVTKASSDYFSFGLPTLDSDTDFIPSVYGIDDHEQIKRGDIRKVGIECRIPYTSNQLRSVEGIDYRLYVLEGLKQYDVIEWTNVERGYNENYFLINTNELIPSRYYIDLRVHKNLELINHPKILQFDIINDVTDNLV